MDILRFFNSCDVREHLKNINYRLSSLEAAWLVWQCKSATLAEKYAAWNDIIDTMPDCKVPRRIYRRGYVNLHDFLREYMRVIDKYLQMFYENSGECVYSIEWRYGTKYIFQNPPFGNRVFSDLASCMDNVLNYADDSVKMLSIEKKWLNSNKKMVLEMLPDQTVYDIEINSFDSKYERQIFNNVFRNLSFEIPIPFKRGDIICRSPYNDGYKSFANKPRIFLKVDFCSESYIKQLFIGKYGEMITITDFDYLNFEYYMGELEENDRIMTVIHRYYNEKIDLSVLLNACLYLAPVLNMDEEIKTYMKYQMDQALTDKND